MKSKAGHRNPKPYAHYLNTFVLHFRPRTIPEGTLKFTHTWGLGGMATVLVMLLMGTGLLLKFYYLPSPEKAYQSVLYLKNEVLFGGLVRNIHYWSANLVLMVVFLHFIRVFLTGAFHAPRRFNWVVGLCIFLLLLLSNFTGYLLPWDQLSYWAVTISVGMLEYLPFAGRWLQEMIQGGVEMGPATLSNFYAIHTAVLPVLLVSLLLFHFWRVRKAGGVVIPRKPDSPGENQERRVPTIPHLLLRELTVALAVVAVILVLSILFEAPLMEKANPGLSPNPTKAPWYFMGIQELLLHFHPLFALLVIPLSALFFIFTLPYFHYPENPSGIWLISAKGRKMAWITILFAVPVTVVGILIQARFQPSPAGALNVQATLSGGAIPFVLCVMVMSGFCLIIKRLFSADRNETVQNFVLFLLTAFLVFTVTGIWFRGSGMRLMWPWGGM